MNNIIIEKVNLNTLPCYNTYFYKPNDRMDYSNDLIVGPNFSTFIDQFKRIYWSYTFTENECKILIDYAKEGSMTVDRRILLPIQYNDFKELDDIIRRLTDVWIPGRWFIRFEGRSPKDGRWEFPMVSPEDTIEQIITSARALYALNTENNYQLYFIEFKDYWKKHQEFRVFICNGKINAISQYYAEHNYYKDMDNDILSQLVIDIKEYIGKIIFPPNCTIDVCYIIETQEIELIEIGSFGYTSLTGSAMFDWMIDYDKLYGTQNDKTYLRINTGDD